MGCDIHIIVERDIGDKWIAVNTFDLSARSVYPGNGVAQVISDTMWPLARNRNYKRFAALAGVRGDGPEPRGLPEDASETTAYFSAGYGCDGHSHSWMTLDEVLPIFVATTIMPENRHPASYFFDVDYEIGQHRIVFWFDN